MGPEGGEEGSGESKRSDYMAEVQKFAGKLGQELRDQQDKMDGKKKGGDVAKPSVQAVQNEQTHTEVEVIDLNDVNGVKIETIDLEERALSPSETDKKEEVVKSMKKNLSGFKDRYGDRAKSVMYATATKQAKKD